MLDDMNTYLEGQFHRTQPPTLPPCVCMISLFVFNGAGHLYTQANGSGVISWAKWLSDKEDMTAAGREFEIDLWRK